MNGRNGPMSPVSVGESEWSGISKYNNNDNESLYSPNPMNRGQVASPPISSGSNGTMNGAFPPRAGSPAGGPSPPSSVARSSLGTGGGRKTSMTNEQFEAILSDHYVSLKRYLAQSLRDEKGNPRPNRARDKLLRLSSVQFQELSTDVFDELLRRQQNGRRTPNGGPEAAPPPYLLPEKNFHPKRNQARQKLSTLPPPRFRDLATDVFYELERRFPRFAGGDLSRVGSPASSMRGPPSRAGNGTPVNGAGRGRRPSDASSVAGFSARSESRNGPRMGPQNGAIPPSPGMPPNDYGRPTPKTFQSNTIVPNKSTMVEDDDEQTGGEDDEDDGNAFGLEGAAGRDRNSAGKGSETDKKLIDDYQAQVAELREKLDAMEDALKQKDDELTNVMDDDRKRSMALNLEKKEWQDKKTSLENAVADVQNLNDTLQSDLDSAQSDLDRARAAQANIERELRAQIEELRAKESTMGKGNKSLVDADLQLENEELREEIREQQQITDDVRREAQEFLREMRMLSERSNTSFEREEQLTNTIHKLEEEVKDWRNRYARTKTQLRSLRASSIGLTIQQDAAKYAKDSGFTQENGLVKDVHVTKFQISIDELLRTARTDDPVRVTEFMKSVIVNVRRISQDIDESPSSDEDMMQQQAKLKSRVSATANNLITASKNFAGASGLSPVSLLDAAASHLTAAVVELVRTVKIRPTPAGELEDDDDGHLAPVDTTGFFPVREVSQDKVNMAPPPVFMGLRNDRSSADSSMYSPVNSPRESGMSNMRPRSTSKGGWSGRPMSRGAPSGLNYTNGNKILPVAPMGTGFGIRTDDTDVEELKIYLEDQTAVLVQTIQSLVSSIRSEAGITAISNQITAIADVVGKVVSSTETAMSSTGNSQLRAQGEPILRKLSNCRERLLDAGEQGRDIADEGRDDDEGERIWRAWNQSLPPIAFEIARETKELVLRVDVIDGGGEGDDGEDFS
ncbi:protein SPA2 [Phlyctema vagabunda]|uniref:Protein SPA2 n=1 Tax=Phlyctema vagabunda TaxID=108571 RepID=A0ABR4PFV7_9HELO